jgi:hypothetical protein
MIQWSVTVSELAIARK